MFNGKYVFNRKNLYIFSRKNILPNHMFNRSCLQLKTLTPLLSSLQRNLLRYFPHLSYRSLLYFLILTIKVIPTTFSDAKVWGGPFIVLTSSFLVWSANVLLFVHFLFLAMGS